MYNEIRSAVVSYRNSTSNHNYLRCYPYQYVLYLIEILHQTTTRMSVVRLQALLYLIEILHQTTTNEDSPLFCYSCILSKFYIKPQPRKATSGGRGVVSYRNSTSNHNAQTRTIQSSWVVSYRNSTSNHNQGQVRLQARWLYLIEILHQTTTTEAVTTSDS